MENRRLPFGYQLHNGTIQTESKESGCVRWIFQTYLDGASLEEIASELNFRGEIPYNKTAAWNKNMIDRILQDRRYSGDALYPEIISEELFQAVQRQRDARSHTKRQSPAQRMIRILGGGRVSQTAVAGVITTMNHLIKDPDAVQCPEPSSPDQTQHFRAKRELDIVMDQQPIDEDRAANLIKRIAEAEYELISNNDYDTERLRRIFRSAESMDELSVDLLQETVSSISVNMKSIQLTLKNNQTIKVSDVT